MGFGGPVWHSSVALARPFEGPDLSPSEAERYATKILKGVGDASLGEWKHTSDLASHVRRRLSIDEQVSIGRKVPADIRGTPEHYRRSDIVRMWAPPQIIEAAGEELI